MSIRQTDGFKVALPLYCVYTQNDGLNCIKHSSFWLLHLERLVAPYHVSAAGTAVRKRVHNLVRIHTSILAHEQAPDTSTYRKINVYITIATTSKSSVRPLNTVLMSHTSIDHI